MDASSIAGSDFKRRDALIQLALARAAGAYAVKTALAGALSQLNGAPLTAANPTAVVWAGSAFTRKNTDGPILVFAGMSGSIDAVDIVASAQIFRTYNATHLAIGPVAIATAGHATADFSLFTMWIDTPSGPTGALNYSFEMTSAATHVTTVATGQAVIGWIPLPHA